jgi:hypothetical protein
VTYALALAAWILLPVVVALVVVLEKREERARRHHFALLVAQALHEYPEAGKVSELPREQILVPPAEWAPGLEMFSKTFRNREGCA